MARVCQPGRVLSIRVSLLPGVQAFPDGGGVLGPLALAPEDLPELAIRATDRPVIGHVRQRGAAAHVALGTGRCTVKMAAPVGRCGVNAAALLRAEERTAPAVPAPWDQGANAIRDAV